MIKIEPLSADDRASFAVCAELEHPTVLMLKVMEHSASWPEYEILELAVGKSRTVVDYMDIESMDQITWSAYRYNPEDPMVKILAKGEGGHGGHLVVDSDGNKHLPTKTNGKVNRRLLGAAWAALHGGYRGNKYEGPNKQQAINKLKRLYAREGMKTPGEK